MFVITAAGHQLSLHCTSQLSLLSPPGQDTPPLLQSILSTMITTLALSAYDTVVCPLFLFAINRYIYRIVNLNVIYFVFNNHIYLHYID